MNKGNKSAVISGRLAVGWECLAFGALACPFSVLTVIQCFGRMSRCAVVLLVLLAVQGNDSVRVSRRCSSNATPNRPPPKKCSKCRCDAIDKLSSDQFHFMITNCSNGRDYQCLISVQPVWMVLQVPMTSVSVGSRMSGGNTCCAP